MSYSNAGLWNNWSAGWDVRCSIPLQRTPPNQRTPHSFFAKSDPRLGSDRWRHRTNAQRRNQHDRSAKDLSSVHLLLGMSLLLSWCGWICGGTNGARRAIASTVVFDDLEITPAVMLRRFNARQLMPQHCPQLFGVLEDITRRSRLDRTPDLYFIAGSTLMNAFAIGKPHRSAIAVTEGLLTKLTIEEVGAILAHEVAHISNSDGITLNLAGSFQQAICAVSAFGLAKDRHTLSIEHRLLLRAAPAIGELLYLALSRVREFAADALVFELAEHPWALASALEKLERHHNSAPDVRLAQREDELIQFLRSHPATRERVGALLAF